MKISYNWLHDFVDLKDLGLDPPIVSQALASVGLAVEGIERPNEDSVFNLDVTSNRPDCLNHLGVARELAAQFRLNLHDPDFSDLPAQHPADLFPARVVNEDAELCPLYAARVMTGVRIEESPAWLKEKLLAVGQRPINNLVDITNYVLLVVGHPLHAFDYEKLDGRTIVVRQARQGETIVTLDGTERSLDPPMLAICDASKPVAVAGIMGGQNSEISLNTTTILLESAYFAPPSVRSTSKRLGLRTEASYRFERGADPEVPVMALNLACRLIEQIAGGQTVGPVLNENPVPFTRRILDLRQKRISQVLGIAVEPEFVAYLLPRLRFKILEQDDRQWKLQVPGFRVDVEIEDDLVEEVARHYGYDKIPGTYPQPSSPGSFLPTRPQEQALLERLRAAGFYEAVNYAFSTPARETQFFRSATRMVPIANPLTEEDTHLRTSLLPGLIAAARRNLNHGTRDIKLFELGHAFVPREDSAPDDFREEAHLALVGSGSWYEPFWLDCRDDFRFFHLKGIVEALLCLLGSEVGFERVTDVRFLHPGAAARIVVDQTPIGILGELSPELHGEFKFLQRFYVAELNLSGLLSRPLPEARYSPLSRFPVIERDLSFVVDKGVEYDRITSAIKSLSIANLRDVQLIDLYQGHKLPSGKVSLTARLTFADLTRTLTQDDVNSYMERISGLLYREFQAEPRA
jgi:phenylalanyl-tRNA synthetase beta chain